MQTIELCNRIANEKLNKQRRKLNALASRLPPPIYFHTSSGSEYCTVLLVIVGSIKTRKSTCFEGNSVHVDQPFNDLVS
jgi:hypothetical protein